MKIYKHREREKDMYIFIERNRERDREREVERVMERSGLKLLGNEDLQT
jgi:hypothetical protein